MSSVRLATRLAAQDILCVTASFDKGVSCNKTPTLIETIELSDQTTSRSVYIQFHLTEWNIKYVGVSNS